MYSPGKSAASSHRRHPMCPRGATDSLPLAQRQARRAKAATKRRASALSRRGSKEGGLFGAAMATISAPASGTGTGTGTGSETESGAETEDEGDGDGQEEEEVPDNEEELPRFAETHVKVTTARRPQSVHFVCLKSHPCSTRP